MSNPEMLMVAVNTAKWPTDLTEHRMYCCPAKENGFDPAYRHYPAKYIGNYVNKGVKYVAVVAACVRLNQISPDEVLWKFDDIDDDDAIAKANEVLSLTNRNPKPCLVFIQTQLASTDFVYDKPGGLQNSRIYFDLASLDPVDAKDLAAKLEMNQWSTVPKWRPSDEH